MNYEVAIIIACLLRHPSDGPMIPTSGDLLPKGGVTTFLEMPNTSPATTTRELLHDKLDRRLDLPTYRGRQSVADPGSGSSFGPQILVVGDGQVADLEVGLHHAAGHVQAPGVPGRILGHHRGRGRRGPR